VFLYLLHQTHYTTTSAASPSNYYSQYHDMFDHLKTHELSMGYTAFFVVTFCFAVCAVVVMAWLGLVANNPKGYAFDGYHRSGSCS
jgi:hypothetical protein